MSDQWAKHLADKGYTGLSLPSNEFNLLTLAYEYHGARSHELAFEQLAPGVAEKLPKPVENDNLPLISGERTRSFDLDIGLKILSGLISALGAGTLGITAGFKDAKKLTFSYDGISSESLNAIALQMELNKQAVPAAGGLLAQFMGDHLYVVTSVLRAKKISVTATDDNNQTVALEVPVISNAASGTLNVGFTGADKSTVTFDGAAPVAFAVKIYQVVATRDGTKLTLATVKAGSDELKAVTHNHEIDGIPSANSGSEGADADAPTAIVLACDPEGAATEQHEPAE